MSHSLASLDARLTALTDQIKQTNQLIQRLSKYHPSTTASPALSRASSQPASDAASPPSLQRSETGNGLDRTELAADIHEALKQHEENLEWLQQDVEDVGGTTASRSGDGVGVIKRISGVGASRQKTGSGSGEKDMMLGRLSAGCQRTAQELEIARIRFRKAQLQAKRNEEDAIQAEQAAYLADLQAAAAPLPDETSDAQDARDTDQAPKPVVSLFGNRRGPRKDPNATQSDLLLSATTDITSSLRRTHALLTSELSRSRFAKETLDSSNEALKELNERYTSLDDLLSKSRGLLGTLLRSQKSDTWYLETTIYILFATIAWLFFRKLLYGPVLYLVLWPLRILWRVVLGVFGIVGLTGGTSAVQSGPGYSSAQTNIVGGVSQFSQQSNSRQGGKERETGLSGTMSQAVSSIIDSVSAAAPSGEAGQDAQQQENAQGRGAGSEDQGSSNQEQGRQQGNQPVRRGDGQVLQERDEQAQPRNPKKRMMEGDGAQGRRDEL